LKVNGVEKARAGTATSYDTYGAGWTANMANDGSLTTGYCSSNTGVDTNWWKLDLKVR
jgi:hypothetical protein